MTKRELLELLEIANDEDEINIQMYWFTPDGTRCARIQDLTEVFCSDVNQVFLIADELDEEPSEPNFPGFSTS